MLNPPAIPLLVPLDELLLPLLPEPSMLNPPAIPLEVPLLLGVEPVLTLEYPPDVLPVIV